MLPSSLPLEPSAVLESSESRFVGVAKLMCVSVGRRCGRVSIGLPQKDRTMTKRRRERTSGMSHVSSGLCGRRDMRGSEELISKPSSMRFESDLREFNLTCSHQRTARA